MKIWKSLAVIALIVSHAAIADVKLVTLVDAWETSPSTMIMPASVNGTMTYKPCPGECKKDFERARLTADTAFAIKGKRVKFEDFRREFDRIRKNKDSYALIRVDRKSRTVVDINIAG